MLSNFDQKVGTNDDGEKLLATLEMAGVMTSRKGADGAEIGFAEPFLRHFIQYAVEHKEDDLNVKTWRTLLALFNHKLADLDDEQVARVTVMFDLMQDA